MKKEISNGDLVSKLKDRGLNCNKLMALEKKQLDDAKKFREVGFNNIANLEESVVGKIRELRKKVCLLN